METLQKTNTLRLAAVVNTRFLQKPFYVDKKPAFQTTTARNAAKSASRKPRRPEKRTLARDDREPYPVITSTKDPIFARN